MAHKGKRGRERGGGSSSSCPSSPVIRLDPRPQPELESTFHPPSSPSTMPCPPGSLLDSIHSSQTPAQVSPHQTSDESSSDAEQQPTTKKSKLDEPVPPRHKAKRTGIGRLRDVTEVALTGKGRTHGRQARSAFDFSPARPPAAYWGRPSGPSPPRDAPPSLATSQRWKMDILRRHVDSFAFHSRDRLQSRVELPESLTEFPTDHAMRIDTFEATGSLLWLQAECLEEDIRDDHDSPWLDGRTFGHTNIDTSGRRLGQERLLGQYGLLDDPDPLRLGDPLENLNESRHRLQHSHLGLSAYAHETPSDDPFYDVVLYDYDEQAFRPRGLWRTQFVTVGDDDEDEDEDDDNDPLEERGGWLVYDRHRSRSTLSALVKQLEPGDACRELLDCMGMSNLDPGRGDDLNLTITIESSDPTTEDQGLSWAIKEFHLAPFGLSFPNVPVPPEHKFTTIAVNQESGFCWMGRADGTVEFLDVIDWIERNFVTCPAVDDDNLDHEPFCPCNVRPIEPVEVSSDNLGAVTNLVSVGQREVVAAFANGSIFLIEADKDRLVGETRQYLGHVNDGSLDIEMAVHAPSRLMAARGTDGQVRIWHLEHPHPLNSDWHRPRAYPRVALDLKPRKTSQRQKQTLQHTAAQGSQSATTASGAQQDAVVDAKAEASEAATAASAAQDDDTWDRLATQGVEEADFAPMKKARFADVRTKPFCGMAWTHTSWLADRDGQWEMTKDFDAAGRPKVVSGGLLPSLVCCSDRPRGTTFLYFEPAKRVGVEDAELVEMEDEESEEEEDARIVYEGAESLD